MVVFNAFNSILFQLKMGQLLEDVVGTIWIVYVSHVSDQLLELWIQLAAVSLMHLPESLGVVIIDLTVVFV